jgi:hypothetical protein
MKIEEIKKKKNRIEGKAKMQAEGEWEIKSTCK